MRPPSLNPITRQFGSGHTGTDYAWTRGGGTIVDKAIRAIAAGQVLEVYTDPRYGKVARIDHGDGVIADYCHAASFISRLKKGASVEEGEVIGTMGQTGSLAEGTHLHLTVRVKGKLTDPKAYIADHPTASGTGGSARPGTIRRRKSMLFFYVNDSKAARGVRYVILTGDGRRADFTSGAAEFPNAVASQLGSAIATDEALIAALQKQFRDSGPAPDHAAPVEATVDLQPLLTVLEHLPADTAREFMNQLASRLNL